jgi:hypothetical protein
MTRPWLATEVGVASAVRQAIGLCRAGLGRPLFSLSLAVASTLLVVCVLIFGRRDYAPSFVLRVVEGEHPSAGMPPLKRQLGEYVRQAIFTSEPLLQLLRRHGLYGRLLRTSPRSALESFKEDISIDVYQNYFVEDRRPGGAPRTARLTVSFHAKDPQLALAVTRDLGRLIVEHELAARRAQALAAATNADQARDTLVAALQLRSREIFARQNDIGGAQPPDPRLQVQLVSLLGSLGSLEHQVEAAERRAATLDLNAAYERRGIGLYFEIVDEGALPARAGELAALLVAGAITFAFGLPLIAIGVGAFSTNQRGVT